MLCAWKKIRNRSGEGSVVGFAKVPVNGGARHGSMDVLLLGEDSMMLARNCLKSKGVIDRHNAISRRSVVVPAANTGLLRHGSGQERRRILLGGGNLTLDGQLPRLPLPLRGVQSHLEGPVPALMVQVNSSEDRHQTLINNNTSNAPAL